MLGSILVGLDGSAQGAGAAELAIRWSRRTGAAAVGLGIVDEPGIRAVEPYRPVGGVPHRDPVLYLGYEAQLADARRRIEESLEEFARRCGAAGVTHGRLSRLGTPHRLILEGVPGYDLIVLGQQARFRFAARDEPDETIAQVLRGSPRPVVVVPRSLAEDGPVLVAYDGSFQAARALAAFEATGLGATVPVHVVSVAAAPEAAMRHAERALQYLRFHGIEATPHPLTSADPPAKQILGEAQRLGAGLLVMGAYGQPTVREFFLGSVTRSVLEDTAVTVFCAH